MKSINITTILNNNKDDYELFGMTPETIVYGLGFETISEDRVEDLQHYINQLHFELESMMAFGV